MTDKSSEKMLKMKEALVSLGLSLETNDYLILAVTLFLGILCALIITVILSSFADNAKSVNALITPVMILIMIPYFLSLFFDMNTASPLIKAIVYLNPVAYPFLAISNLSFGHYNIILCGIAYQIVFFAVFVYIAARLFSSDLIITNQFNFSKKGKS